MSQQFGFNAARKRYHRLFWPAMIAYVTIVIGGAWLVDDQESPKWIAALAAILTTIPIVIALFAIVRWMSETDEYTRLRHLKAFAVAGALTASVVFLVGFLQIFDVVGFVEVFWFGPLFLGAYGLADCLPRLFGKTV